MKIDKSVDQIKQNNPDAEINDIFSNMWNVDLEGNT